MNKRVYSLKLGERLPERHFKPDNVQLFLYNAALWNAHRIHFDHSYATDVEGYPGLVIAGPLLGDWLTQSVIEWLAGDGRLQSIEYSNRQASYVGEVLRSGGQVVRIERDSGVVELEMYIKNEADQVITPGTAVAVFL